MVNTFYQNKIQPTVDKTKNIFEESQTIPISTLTGLIGSVIVMIILNSSYPIVNSDELDVLVIGNALIGFVIFSFIFTVMTSIAVIYIFSIIIAPSTKKQLVEIKNICIDYTQIFRELRIKRYEFDEDRTKSIFNYELNNAMKQMEQRFINQTKSSLSKANSMIMKQNTVIEELKNDVSELKRNRIWDMNEYRKVNNQLATEKIEKARLLKENKAKELDIQKAFTEIFKLKEQLKKLKGD